MFQRILHSGLAWLLILFGIGFASIILVAGLTSRSRIPSSGTPLTINKEGAILQGTQRIGHFLRQGDSARVTLPISEASNQEFLSPSFSIIFPQTISGEVATIHSIQGTSGMSVIQDSPNTLLASFTSLSPESHTSLTLTLPSDYFELPFSIRFYSTILAFTLIDWIIIALGLLFLTLLTSLILTRRPRTQANILRTTPPDDLLPLEMSLLLKSHIEASDIAALVYDLASRGLVEIIESPSDTFFVRTSLSAPLTPYEELILDFLCSTTTQKRGLQATNTYLSDTLFSKFVGLVYATIYQKLQEGQYFRQDLRLLHLRFKGLSIAVQGISLTLIAGNYFILNSQIPGLLILGISGYISGFILYRAGYRISPLTEKGRKTTQEVKEFVNFLRNPLPIGASGTQGVLFYQYLPYALITRSEDQWFYRFRKESIVVPTWFTSQLDLPTPENFLKQLHQITLTLGRIMVHLKDPNVD